MNSGSGTSFRPGLHSVISVENEGHPHRESLLSTFGEDLHVQPWPATAAIIVAEVVGTGVLALGGNFGKLGWIAGFSVLVVGFVVNNFTSILLSYAYREFPSAVACGDVAYKLLGRRTAYCFYGVQYTYIFLCCANYIIIISDSILSVFYWLEICRPTATLIGVALLIPPNQFRTLSGLTYLSGFSFATITVTIVICLGTLLSSEDVESACNGRVDSPSLLTYSAAVCGFIFAYTGQSIMLEMQVEMKRPADFPKAVISSFSVLLIIYVLVCAVSYSKCGPKTPGELLTVLPKSGITSVAGVLMVLHLLVTYTILQQVLVRAICVYFVPRAVLPGRKGHVQWFFVSATVICLSWVLANVIPYFSDIVNITGGLLSTQCAFTVPCTLYLALWKQGFLKTGRGTQFLAIASAATLLLSAYCTISGTISNVILLQQHAAEGGESPFGCKLET